MADAQREKVEVGWSWQTAGRSAKQPSPRGPGVATGEMGTMGMPPNGNHTASPSEDPDSAPSRGHRPQITRRQAVVPTADPNPETETSRARKSSWETGLSIHREDFSGLFPEPPPSPAAPGVYLRASGATPGSSLTVTRPAAGRRRCSWGGASPRKPTTPCKHSTPNGHRLSADHRPRGNLPRLAPHRGRRHPAQPASDAHTAGQRLRRG